MLTIILGYLGSAAGGSLIKFITGTVSDLISNSHEKEIANINARKREGELHVQAFNQADDYVKTTRRVLAWLIAGTYCCILLLWAIFPQVWVCTLIPLGETSNTGYGIAILGYEVFGTRIPVELRDRAIMVTTGHLVVANSYFLTFILSAYFTPAGRR